MLLGKINEGMTAWNYAAYRENLKLLNEIWKFAKEKLTTEELINKILLGTDYKGRTFWHWAAEKGNLKLLHKI